MIDEFTPYETGLAHLREQPGQEPPTYNQVLVYQQRLTENINAARQHGDTENLRHERSRIMHALNEITQSILGVPFVDLCPGLPPPRPSPIETYLSQVRDYCDRLPYVTLSDVKRLGEIYVPLKLRLQGDAQSGSVVVDKGESESRNPSNSQNGQDKSGSVFTLEAALRRTDRVVILGEPGMGKSSLLRQLARHAWDTPESIGLAAPHLPILVPLQRLAGGGSLESRLATALPGELFSTQDLPPGFLADWPARTGRPWLLLLDALDEAPKDKRPDLVRWLVGQIKNLGPCCVVITSRLAGYDASEFREEKFQCFELVPFDRGQANELAHHWLGNRASHFLQELGHMPDSNVSDTPLLLTIAAKVYLRNGTLPTRRSELYEQFVSTWFDEAKRRDLEAELDKPVCDVARFGLAQLALAMIEQPAVSAASLSQVAAAYLKTAASLSPDLAQVTGERFVEVMTRRSGVLVQRAGKCEFIHATFRDYLAAEAISQACAQVPNQMWDHDQAWRRAISRWQEEEWREVVRFALGILSKQDVSGLCKRIWEQGEDGLYFAGTALADGVNVDGATQHGLVNQLLTLAWTSPVSFYGAPPAFYVLSRLRGFSQISKSLLNMVRASKATDEQRPLAIQVLGRIGEIGHLADLACARDVETWLRVRAAVELARLGQRDEATAVLQQLAGDDQLDAWECALAAEALGNLGRIEQAVTNLQRIARDDKAKAWERVRAARALRQLGKTEEAAGILEKLESDATIDADDLRRVADEWELLGQSKRTEVILQRIAKSKTAEDLERVWAVRTLIRLGQTADAVETLEEIAGDSHVTAIVRQTACETIGELGQVTEALTILRGMARDPQLAIGDRVRAAEAMSELGQVSEAAAILLALARGAPEQMGTLGRIIAALTRSQPRPDDLKYKYALQDRQSAIETLGRLGQTQDLAALARDRGVEKQIQVRAVETMGQHGQMDEAQNILRRLATTEKRAEIRIEIAEALSRLGCTQDAISALRELASSGKLTQDALQETGQALIKLGQVEEAMNILRKLAEDKKMSGLTRVQAARKMGEMGRTEALQTLACAEEIKAYERVGAAKALGQLGEMKIAVTQLCELARDGHVAPWEREEAVKALGELRQVEDLKAMASDKTMEPQIRMSAAIALSRLRQEAEAAVALVDLAHDERVAPDVRVQAAAELGRLGHEAEAQAVLSALAGAPQVEARIRRRAAEALGQLGAGDQAMPPLLALLRNSSVADWVRRDAAQTLGEYGDTRVLADLEHVTANDKYRNVRRAAQEAIRQIRQRTEAASG